ncbi:MAG: uroporphyrinogen decarboxylase family protein [Thermacetogeniaceae bacterium]
MSDPASLMRERVQLYKDAARHRKTSRVLNLANMWTWIVYDSGYKLSEALFDSKIMGQAVTKFQEKYQFDFFMDFGFRNPLAISGALGHTDYIIDDEAGSLNISDFSYVEPDDYDEIIENYDKFLWTKFLPRKYKKLNGPGAKGMMINAAIEFGKFAQYATDIVQTMATDYGVPPSIFTATPFFINFYEILFNWLRGIKGISLDLRQRPDKLKAALDSVGVADLSGNTLKAFKQTSQKGTDQDRGPDVLTSLLGHSILSKKQFEVFYWPYLKEIFDYVQEYDKILHIFAESENSRFYDFFKEAPKGHVVIYLELDDMFKAKKEIGDTVCLCGGMPVDLLYRGTAQENIAYAKRLIDELAYDGGFIFSQNKMVSYGNDCKAENLKAVNDFIREYTL